MLPLRFTVEEAISFSKHGCIEEWVHTFLKTTGDNVPFSEGLKLQRRYWAGPVLIPLNQLKRCCGPEEDMEFRVSADHWDKKIASFRDLIRNGWEYAPLIVQIAQDRLIVSDGNHRYEALRTLNHEDCWVILWGSDGPIDSDTWAKVE